MPGLDGRFEPGRAQMCRKGRDLLLVAMGTVATEAAAAESSPSAASVHGDGRRHVNPPPGRPSSRV